jgi:hypothetical protein
MVATVYPILAVGTTAQAGDGLFGRRKTSTVVRGTRTTYTPTQAFRPMTGTFYPTPYMTVGGNGFTGGAGYTPLSQYGDGALAMYGPIAALRPATAPLTFVSRGYDGSYQMESGTGFSYPFLPAASPVVFPTRSQVRGSLGYQTTPPSWDTAHGWIDQN